MARPGFTNHRKFSRLVHLLGMPEPYVLGHLEYLWAASYENGEPIIGDSLDVELTAKWIGEVGKLTKALLDCGGTGSAGLIEPVEGDDNVYQIHDLFDHAPEYVRKRAEREAQRRETGKSISDVRRAAAKARWKNAPAKQAGANGIHLHGVASLHAPQSPRNGVENQPDDEKRGNAKSGDDKTSATKTPVNRTNDANECRLHANGRTPAPAPAPINTLDAARLTRTPKAKPVKAANPNHHKAKLLFVERWHAKFGEGYTFANGKDAAALSRILTALGNDMSKFSGVVDRYLASTDKFYAGHTLAKLSSDINKFKIAIPVADDDDAWRGGQKDPTPEEADALFRRAGMTGGDQ